eukprot:COSAG01_NODE_17771_length_1125_cov_1.478558_1_plen_102_part_10
MGSGGDSAMVTGIKHTFCGAAAGAVTKTSTAPLERVKIIMQVHGMKHGAEGGKCVPAPAISAAPSTAQRSKVAALAAGSGSSRRAGRWCVRRAGWRCGARTA